MPRFTDDQGFDLVDWDAASGKTVWAKEEFGQTVYRTDYPADSIIKLNGEQRNIAEKAWKGDYHHVASIPLNEVHGSGLVEAFSQNDQKHINRYLNDSDNRAWRTKEGNL